METQSLQTGAGPTVQVGGQEIPHDRALSTVRSSGSWFFWVAGLSIVNSIAALLGTTYGMILGLGITQIVDAVILAWMEEGGSSGALRAIPLVFTVIVAGFFIGIGVIARRVQPWAFAVGMTAYALDALIFLMVGDWIGVGFHAFVLFMLWGGFRTARAVRAASSSQRLAA